MSVQPDLFGDERALDLSQWYTPDYLAHRLVMWALENVTEPIRILEPAAGEGALIKPIPPQHYVVAYDIDPRNIRKMEKCGRHVELRCRNFLQDPDPGHFDLCIMNSPYENDLDLAFARRVLLDGIADRCDALMRSVFRHGVNRWNNYWRWADLLREIDFIDRPKFGGAGSPMSDFSVFETVARKQPRTEQQRCNSSREWWRARG